MGLWEIECEKLARVADEIRSCAPDIKCNLFCHNQCHNITSAVENQCDLIKKRLGKFSESAEH